jgi:thioester reductase-like protein
MGAVLLTGATGFVGKEILSRFLERGDRLVYALVRADNDHAAAERLPAHDRLAAVAGDIEQPGLGLARETAERLREEVTTVVHCAASVSFDLPLDESRRVNVDGTRHVLELARSCTRLERFSYVSTAYVAGEPPGVFREDQLDVGQRFRNPYERSKFEAELMLRREGAGLPLQILRPSIVVGDSSTGRTSSFNVLYGPLKAYARGAVPAIPARRDAPVDVVPVDYVADRVHELATGGPDGTFHLVAGRNATTVGRLLELSSAELGRAEPTVLPPRLYRRWVHPWLRRKYGGLRRMEVYFPYFSMRVRFDDRRLGPGPRVEGYFHRLVRYAQAVGWGRR